jgi:DNA repair exonuclease SbcCD nuclease subunit
MKYILLSDIHFSNKQPVGRIDDIYQAGLEKLNIIFDHSCSEQIPIIEAGDLFHESTNRKCLNDVIRLFNKYDWLKGRFYCVYGNHDMYKINKKDTCLNILENIGYVKILSGFHEHVYCDSKRSYDNIYGMSWGDDEQLTMQQNSIFVVHKSITNSTAMFDTESAKDFINGFTNTLVLCGHIHEKFVVDGGNSSRVINTGPIIRRSVDEKDHSPCYAVIDTANGGLEWHLLPDKAEFSKEHIELKKDQERSKIDLANYIGSISGFKVTIDFKENLIGALITINDATIKEKLESYLR